MRKIKLLFVNGGLMDYGGISSFICNYLKYFDFNKFEVTIAVHGNKFGQRDLELKNMGCKIVNLPIKSKTYIHWKRKLKELLLREKYDIIHANADAGNGPLLRIAKQCNVQIRISHSHNTRFLTENRLKIILNNYQRKQIIHYATHLFACSKDAGSWLYGENKFEVIYNAIDYDKFRFNENVRNQVRESLEIHDNTYVVGHVGRFDYQKNHKFILEIAEQMKDKNVLFLLMGDGHLHREIESNISDKSLRNITLIGEVSNVSDYLNAMDCFIMPSLFEGLSVVSIEAQANGLKCFFSNKITMECKVIESVEFLKISDASYWVNLLSRNMEKYEHNRYTEINMNYNLEIQSEKLQKTYLDILGRYYEN